MLLFRLLPLAGLLSASLHAGMLAHWKLDSTPADATDTSPLVWENGPAYSTAVAAPSSSAAATLSGSKTWLNAGTGFNLERNQPFSASAWIKGWESDATVIGDMSLDDRKGWELHIGTTLNGGRANSVTVWLVNSYPGNALQVNAWENVLDNKWHHVAFTYDGSSTAAGLKIYIDGKPATTTVGINKLAGSIADNNASLIIGSRINALTYNNKFYGDIDEVALFDHAMTATELNSVFVSGVESLYPPKITDTVPVPDLSVTTLTTADVTFSFPVNGVAPSDLLVNGVAASAVQAIDAKTYRFIFASPSHGDVIFTWSANHTITGLFGARARPEGWVAHLVPVLPPPQIAIAEFLCKNAGGMEDEDHDTPDWIELVNTGTVTVNLAGWALTDDPTNPRAWVLPAVSLIPGARRIIFASGKNRISGNNLHANFKLADGGGYLALSNPSGEIAHAYDRYPRQEGNVSFGLSATGKAADGRAAWRYLSPTPNAPPGDTVYSGGVISDMTATPAAPIAGNAINVTLRTSPEAVMDAAPQLFYRIMHGPETSINFADDGQHGDGAAGDLVWGATIPAGATAGQMVRWRASLSSGSVISRWPVNDMPAAPRPLYEGVVIGGNTAGQPLPVYQVFVEGYQFPTSTRQTGIDSSQGARGAFYGNGKLYDNVFIRIKGTTSRSLLKRSHRVDFNPGRDFEWSAAYEPQRELNLNSEYVDPSYLRQNQQLWMHRDSGNAGSPHFPVRLLMNGENWQFAFHTYPADSELIKVLGLDPRGALYKQVGILATYYGEQMSRRWDPSRTDLRELNLGLSSNNESRTRYVYDNLNLPAVINYLAIARVAQEGDDVWANMTVYRDTEGTQEWRPIPFDLNLSFGQLFYGFSEPYNTTVQATTDTNKSHPLYGSASCQTNIGNNGYNRLYDAIIQEPVTRAMLLRRIRTLTDRYLAADAASSPLEKNFDNMGALIKTDADIDRAKWGLPPNAGPYGLGPGISPAQGLATLKTSFLAPRRTHFYTTHSINNAAKTLGIGNNNKAGIPNAQAASPVITFGTIEAHPANGNQNEEYIQLTNPGTDAIDISDWTVRGSGGSFKMKGGTVIPAAGSLYVSPDVAAFRKRATSPKANESRFVVGPYSGHLSPYGETLRLENAIGQLVAQVQVSAYQNAPPVTLAVTEIMSSSSHISNKTNGDWWELTNTGGVPIDLSGLSWSDNSNPPVKIPFPGISLSAGESIIILNEDDGDEAGFFRSAWGLSNAMRILTREDFGLEDLPGLGSNDSVILYNPTNSIVARADYTSHSAGKSRAWFRNGVAIPGGYSQLQKYGAMKSTQSPSDIGSPGFSTADPSTLTDPYQAWSAANDLWLADADPTADPDGDGRTNREEYIFGGNARLADNPPAPSIHPAAGGFEWTFTRRTNDPSVTVILESSTNLIHWSTITPQLLTEHPSPSLTGHKNFTYAIPRESAAKFLRARSE